MKKFSFILCFCVAGLLVRAQNGSLVSISPNQAVLGQFLSTTITGSGTYFISSSPPWGGVWNIYLDNNAGQYIYANMPTYTDDEHLDAAFNIPLVQTPGIYDLNLEVTDILNPWQMVTLSLPACFTIQPPDGMITGSVYEDLNTNGVRDAGEPGVPNSTISINPPGISVATNSNGDYTFGYYNGNYTVTWLQNNNNFLELLTTGSFPVTINNDTITGIDFGVKRKLISISPNYGYKGIPVTATITADGIFGSPPTSVYLSYAGSIIGTAVTVNNVNEIVATFNISPVASIGTYELVVRYGTVYHRLPGAFLISSPDGYITGKVFYDYNGDGIKDMGEPGVFNRTVERQPGGILAQAAAVTGDYSLSALNGNYSVNYYALSFENLTTVSSYNVTVNNNTVSGNDFGVQFDPFDSLRVLTWQTGNLRCFNTVLFYAQVWNHGGNTAHGNFYFVKSSNVGFSSSNPPPDVINGDTLVWYYSNILPLQAFGVSIYLNMPGPNNMVYFSAIGEALDAGSNVVFTDQDYLSGWVTCSFDPNDKQVSPPGEQAPHYTLFSNELDYTIRFQNTGTDTAFKVVILDTLDADLDYSTFYVTGNSHPMSAELNPANGALKFTFLNILLPDSNVNEPASHGYVTYSIRTQSGLPVNTIVNNTAHIIFDLNDPVVTNTTFNTMVYTIPTGIIEHVRQTGQAVVYPNPFDKSATLLFKNEFSETFHLQIVDGRGRIVIEQYTDSDYCLISKGQLESGMYMFRLVNEESATSYSGRFVIR